MEATMEATHVGKLSFAQQSLSSSRVQRQDFSHGQKGMLAQKVAQTLIRNAYLSAKDFDCTSDGFTVHLMGKVPSYYVKAVAQTIAAKVDGVRRVVNDLQVIRDEIF